MGKTTEGRMALPDGYGQNIFGDPRIGVGRCLQISVGGPQGEDISFFDSLLLSGLRVDLDPASPGYLGQRVRQFLQEGPVGAPAVEELKGRIGHEMKRFLFLPGQVGKRNASQVKVKVEVKVKRAFSPRTKDSPFLQALLPESLWWNFGTQLLSLLSPGPPEKFIEILGREVLH